MEQELNNELNLLFPDGVKSNARSLSDLTIQDLALDRVARAITGGGADYESIAKVLGRSETDAGIIGFRQEILRDLMAHPDLALAFERVIPYIDEITRFVRTSRETDSPLLTAVWRIGELEMYSLVVNDLSDTIAGLERPLESAGLQALTARLNEIRAEESFQTLQVELPELLAGIRKRQSLTLGVNLDDKLRPVEATILSVNEHPFRSESILGGFLKQVKPEYRTHTPLHQTLKDEQGKYSTKIPLSPLFMDLNEILKSLVKPLNRTVESYLSINSRFLRRLRRDFAFYLGALQLQRKFAAAGIATCFPEILPADSERSEITGFVNLQLALTVAESAKPGHGLVPNDAVFDHDAGFYLLTGPNQGGKTTFIQGLSLIFACAQAGLFVPAESARIVPADHILTHFPSEERGRLTTGRLSEELERLDEIFGRVTSHSLVILNETFSSTSPGEATRLAEDIVLGLRMIGARGVFATHLHELALRIPQLNEMVHGPNRIASLVAQIEQADEAAGPERTSDPHTAAEDDQAPARRSYRIIPAPPEGRSFALDIARKHRLSLEDLQSRLRDRLPH
ncbi:MAG: MutS-related protein [Spirochaeta sp.]